MWFELDSPDVRAGRGAEVFDVQLVPFDDQESMAARDRDVVNDDLVAGGAAQHGVFGVNRVLPDLAVGCRDAKGPVEQSAALDCADLSLLRSPRYVSGPPPS